MIFNLDYNAGAPPDPEVVAGMREIEELAWGNPHAQHQIGQRARRVLEDARDRIAACLCVRSDEVIFTSGGTEANNLVAFAAMEWMRKEGGRFWVSPLAHSSMWEPFAFYQARFPESCALLAVDSWGRVALESLAGLRDPWFASVVLGHHELGVIQDLEPLKKRGGKNQAVHLDVSQAVGRMDLRAAFELGDAFTLSPHKAGGPRGIGVLIWKGGRPFQPLLLGGGQELGRRPGTQAPLLAHGASLALEKALFGQQERARRMGQAMSKFLKGIQDINFEILGPKAKESILPNTRTLRFPGVKARDLIVALDLLKVAVSQGSACSSGSTKVSRTLLSLGLAREEAGECLRISLGPDLSSKKNEQAASLFSQGLRRFFR